MLREMQLHDLDFVAVMLAHPEVMQFWPKTYSRAEAEAWIRRQQERYAEHGYGLWLAVDRVTDVPVGQVGVVTSHVEDADEPALSYLIHRPFWRRGYATEAAAACRDYVFDRLDRPWVVTLIRPENVPSQGVATKLGMVPGRSIPYKGFEHVVYSVTREARAARGASP